MKVITGMFYLECNTFNPELVTKEKFIVSTGDTALIYLHVSDIFENAGFENADPKKASCKKELALTLEELVKSAKRCLKFGGRFVLCHRADRAAEVIYTLHEAGLEPKLIQFVTGKAGREPYLVLISAKKGAKKGVKVLNEKVNEGN